MSTTGFPSTFSPASLPGALSGAYPGASSAPALQSAAASTAAARQASDWFNEPLAEASQVLRAPVQPTGGDADALCDRFLNCLGGPA